MMTEAGPESALLLERAVKFGEFPALQDCTAEVMRQLTEKHGVDFATAVLYQRFLSSPRHAPFIHRIESLMSTPSEEMPVLPGKVFLLPGALYKERPGLGSEGRVIREALDELGIGSGLVPLDSRGSVQHNAGLLSDWLDQQLEEKMVLISISKGGPDLKLALSRPDAATRFRNVVAWVNLSGPLDGSPVANWIPDSRLRSWAVRLQYRIQRRDFGFITDLCHGPDSPLHPPLMLPAHMKLISLLGFPLRSHLTTPLSRFCHGIIAKSGPTDSTILLSDAITWPGDIFPVWGADHYFHPPERSKALITAIVRSLVQTNEDHVSSEIGRL